MQVVCWVLGEYGTADGTHSADVIIGKLCDVAEAHPGDTVVKVRVPLFSCIMLFSIYHVGGIFVGVDFYCLLNYRYSLYSTVSADCPFLDDCSCAELLCITVDMVGVCNHGNHEDMRV